MFLILSRNDDMDQVFVFVISFGDIDVVEIGNVRFNITLGDLNVDDCFFVS